jgi:general secretion pathway protein A
MATADQGAHESGFSLSPALLAAVAIGLLVGAGAFLYGNTLERGLRTDAFEAGLRVTRIVAEAHRQGLADVRALLAEVAREPEIGTQGAARCGTALADLLRRAPLLSNVVAVSPAGHVFCSAVPLPTPNGTVNEVLLTRAVSAREFSVGSLTGPPTYGHVALPLLHPVVDEARTVRSVLVALVDPIALARLAAVASLPPTATFAIIDQAGIVHAHHPESARRLGRPIADPGLIRGAPTTGEQTTVGAGLDGRARFISSTPLSGGGTRFAGAWAVVGIVREHGHVRLLQAAGLTIGVLAGVAGVVLGLQARRDAHARERRVRVKAAARPPAAAAAGSTGQPSEVEPGPVPDVLVATEGPEPAVAVPGAAADAVSPAPADIPEDTGDAPAGPEPAGPRSAIAGPDHGGRPLLAENCEAFWGLSRPPFDNSPNPAFLYLSPAHADALVRLTYAVERRRGIAMLTGHYGCGKTTMSRVLIQRLDPDRYEIALLGQPTWTVPTFLREILYQVGVETSAEGRPALLHQLHDVLVRNLERGRDTLVVVDEAQLIDDPLVLEELRLLLNLQTDDRFLITVVLIGSPELLSRVRQLPHLDQRIAVRCHLDPLDADHTARYVAHRLAAAGRATPVFTDAALRAIHASTQGAPRMINNVCDLALLVGALHRLERIDADTIGAVVEDYLAGEVLSASAPIQA